MTKVTGAAGPMNYGKAIPNEAQLELFHEQTRNHIQSLKAATAVDATLAERGKRYGTFKGHAEVSQAFKDLLAIALEKRGKLLDCDQQEALEMIFHKIARIVNGDHNYHDSWHDIAGYAKLVADRLETGKEV